MRPRARRFAAWFGLPAAAWLAPPAGAEQRPDGASASQATTPTAASRSAQVAPPEAAADARPPAAARLAWQQTPPPPPDFAATFPYDPDAARQLEQDFDLAAWRAAPPADGLERIRRALHATTDSAPLLRWVGTQYIPPPLSPYSIGLTGEPQNPRAIELMYHASASTDTAVRAGAVIHGLANVEAKNEAILRAMAVAALSGEDPRLLEALAALPQAERGRIAALVEQLGAEPPFGFTPLELEARRQIALGELDPFAWSRERARWRAQMTYGDMLGSIRDQLTTGEGNGRLALLRVIDAEQLMLILDASYVPAFAAAAGDADPAVRELVARLVGGELIGYASGSPVPGVEELMLKLACDVDRGVRLEALRAGLVPLRIKSRAVIERLLAASLAEANSPELVELIEPALLDNETQVREVLRAWIDDVEARPLRAVQAVGLWNRILPSATTPELPAALSELLFGEGHALAARAEIATSATYQPATLGELFRELAQGLPEDLRDRVTTVDESSYPILLLEEGEIDRARAALEARGRLQLGRMQALSADEALRIAEGTGHARR